VYTEEDLCNVPDLEANEGDNKISSIDFTEEDVTALLKKVVADKSPGPDNIHPKVLKECADQLSRPLTILFRKSLKEGKIHVS